MLKTRNFKQIDAEIIASLDVLDEYRRMGVVFDAKTPRASGKISCFSRSRDERNASAWVDVKTGRYGDSANGETHSLWDFAAKYSTSPSFRDWKEAREYFANKVGVKIGRNCPGTTRNPLDALHFMDWTEQTEQRAKIWCVMRKKGASVDAIKAAGGRIAQWPCYWKKDKTTGKSTGEKKLSNDTVVALPCFDPSDKTLTPKAWVLWNTWGSELEVYQGKDQPRAHVKVYSCGSTGGLVMGKNALERLHAGAEGVELVFKTGGPSDMLALFTSIPAELRARYPVMTNASGETGDVSNAMVGIARDQRLIVIHDADEAGEAGATKWLKKAVKVAAEVKKVTLPYSIEKNHGKDVRDYLTTDGHTFNDILALVDRAEPYVAPVADTSRNSHQPQQSTEVGDGDLPLSAMALPITNGEIDRDKENAPLEPLTMTEILNRICEKSEDWPRRVGHTLFIHNESDVAWLENTDDVFGWLQEQFGTIDWHTMTGCPTKSEVFRVLRRTATAYKAIETLPHEPQIADHFYALKQPSGTSGRAINLLLDRFCPDDERDRSLILAMFATVFWGGSGGTRPAFVVVSDAGRGSGKTKLTDMVSYLAGGHVELSQHEDAAVMKQRLLSPEGLKKRIARLDNVKSHKFSWSDLESMITAPDISGKRLYTGEASRPNLLTWLITFNAASFSTDLAQRSVMIKIKPPKHEGSWEADTKQFIDQNREEIISDLIGLLTIEPVVLPSYGRWAAWERGVLSKLPEPESLQSLIAERVRSCDTETDEMVFVEEAFAGRLRDVGYDPDTAKVHIPSCILAEWFNNATGDKRGPYNVGKVLRQAIEEGKIRRLGESPTKAKGRGLTWTGSHCLEGQYTDYHLQERIDRRARKRRAKTVGSEERVKERARQKIAAQCEPKSNQAESPY